MRTTCLLLALATTANLHAVRTDTITQDTYADFFSGELENIALSNLGELKAGPALNEVMVIEDASSIWSAVADSDGNLYVGTGKEGSVYKIAPDAEKPELLFNPDAIMTRALALDDDGNLFVATSPDGAVYRIAPGGRPEVFFDPEEIYVWDMAFGQDGNLYVATGAKANIYQLTPNHQLNDEATPYFTSDRTHFTRMTRDADGALIVGSGPDAYLYRVTAEKEGEVLYSAGTDEIANVAV
ncbi:MAG: two-component regulator propeller domain-containing protein, partial [Puniceicoccales bacterium]